MTKCDFCEKEVTLPFVCKFCGRNFCIEHRLPEKHSCLHVTPRTPIGQWDVKIRAHEPIVRTQTRPSENGTVEPERIVTSSRVNIALVLITIGMIIISSVAVGYLYVQNTRLKDDNDAKYELGYADGNQSGYQVGYDNGYDVGYGSGYPLGFCDGNTTGFTDGYVQGVEDGAGRGYTIRDPTHDEALAFVTLDKTDENEYSENYTCRHFTADFKNNAFKSGYRCGYVYVELVDSAHAIVCFNTTDYGVIFVEPQFDDVVILTIGRSYSDINGYELPSYNDTIVGFDIIW